MSPEEWLRFEFERVWPWLQAALDVHPIKTHEKIHIWEALEGGTAQLWPTPNSCCLTEFKVFPTGVRAINGWLAGGELSEVLQTVKAIEAYARERGFHALSVSGRRGWLKVFDGFQDAGTTLVKELT